MCACKCSRPKPEENYDVGLDIPMLVQRSMISWYKGSPFADSLVLIWLGDVIPKKEAMTTAIRKSSYKRKNEHQQEEDDGTEWTVQFPETWGKIITWLILWLTRRMTSEPAMHANLDKKHRKSINSDRGNVASNLWKEVQEKYSVETMWTYFFLRGKFWSFYTYNGFHSCCVIRETSGTVGCWGVGGIAYIGHVTS